ncbi:MAG: VCBS repeat-containing protein [Kiritimatiellae bacterium]|nr:VCBS repeat-containing protein [Kiritimatiellia bacterium]
MKLRFWMLAALVMLIGSGHLMAAMPQIKSVGPEESAGTYSGSRPSIAADTSNQPHIVLDYGSSKYLYIFHRINDRWSQAVFAVGSPGGRYDASRLYMPRIEIDSRDRAWISCKFGCKEYGSMLGQGLWCYQNMSTSPSEKWFRHVCVHKGNGNVSLDRFYPDRGAVLGTLGNWIVLDSSGSTVAIGNMNSGSSGEKIRFRIASYDPPTQEGVWHSAMCGYSLQPGSYQNSLRRAQGLNPTTWAAYGPYREQGSDFYHPGVGVDKKDPRRAYIACVFNAGLVYNVWDGQRMLFDTSRLPVADPNATFEIRYDPQWCPAPGDDGGAFLCWTTGGRIKLVYVAQDGSLTDPFPNQADPRDVCLGRSGSICLDNEGNMHLAYINGAIRYRFIQLQASRSKVVTKPGDWDGDGVMDPAVSKDGVWYVRQSSDGTLLDGQDGYSFGYDGVEPVPADYDGDGTNDWGVYDPDATNWYILASTAKLSVTNWGDEAAKPVSGDFDGDGSDDLAIYYAQTNEVTGSNMWRVIRSRDGVEETNWWGASESAIPVPCDYDGDAQTDLAVYFIDDTGEGTWLVRQSTDGAEVTVKWGWEAAVPAPADYDGDDTNDIAVYHPEGRNWYVRSPVDPFLNGAPVNWGVGDDAIPVPADYDGDGMADLTVYDASTGYWYIQQSASNNAMMGSAWPLVWGSGANSVPVPGDYDGDGVLDLATFDSSSANWNVLLSDGSTAMGYGGEQPCGWGGVTPVPGDYDGDGTNDLAIFDPRAANWFVLESSTGALLGGGPIQFGWYGVYPVQGDYDLDGKTDIAVYDIVSATWFARSSQTGRLIEDRPIQFGWHGVLPVQADYDNDGGMDIAVFDRVSATWYVRNMATGGLQFPPVAWGWYDVTPVPADYDGDGSANIAVFDPRAANWYIRDMTSGNLLWGQVIQWGWYGPIPVPRDYDGDGDAEIALYDPASSTWFIRDTTGVAAHTMLRRPPLHLGTADMTPLGGRWK